MLALVSEAAILRHYFSVNILVYENIIFWMKVTSGGQCLRTIISLDKQPALMPIIVVLNFYMGVNLLTMDPWHSTETFLITTLPWFIKQMQCCSRRISIHALAVLAAKPACWSPPNENESSAPTAVLQLPSASDLFKGRSMAATMAWSHLSMPSVLKSREGSSTSTAHLKLAVARTAQLLEFRLLLRWVCVLRLGH